MDFSVWTSTIISSFYQTYASPERQECKYEVCTCRERNITKRKEASSNSMKTLPFSPSTLTIISPGCRDGQTLLEETDKMRGPCLDDLRAKPVLPGGTWIVENFAFSSNKATSFAWESFGNIDWELSVEVNDSCTCWNDFEEVVQPVLGDTVGNIFSLAFFIVLLAVKFPHCW